MRRYFMILLMLSIAAGSTSAQVTLFNNSLPSIDLPYPGLDQTDRFFITLPQGTVTEARMDIQGLDILGQTILPADIIIVTDVSGSMGSSGKINAAKSASLSFLDNVNLNYIHVGLVHYSQWGGETASVLRTDLDEHLTDNRADLESEINGYFANGFTNMGGGMELAMDELLGSHAQNTDRKFMIVMTDGIANCYPNNIDNYDLYNTGSGTCNDGTAGRNSATDFVLSITQTLVANDIVVYGVAFGSDANQQLIDQISSLTGGQSYFAPDSLTLKSIYNEIAQSISYQDFPTPDISSSSPRSLQGWSYPGQFSLGATWENQDCGTPQAACSDLRNLLQSNMDQCTAFPCDVIFDAHSDTFGQLTLSNLHIEINEPPQGNYPPLGTCNNRHISCPDSMIIINLDDGSLVTDPNDPPDSLTWKLDSTLQPPSGAHFILDPDYDQERRLSITVDPTHLGDPSWEMFIFNVTDPWGASAMACVNVSYEGCMLCGDGIVEPGEQCDDGNTVGTDSCVDCMNAVCGDGFLHAGVEECDFGPAGIGDDSDGCRDDCTRISCGDGIVDAGEQCDDGNDVNTDACVNCMNAECGDGYLEAGVEECDGNINVGQHERCNDECEVEHLTYCGDGVKQSPNDDHVNEECDGDDGISGDYEHCSSSCHVVEETYCGDGILTPHNYQGDDEECDYGNENGGDFCNGQCQKTVPLFRKYTIKNTDFNSFDIYKQYLDDIWPDPTDVASITVTGEDVLSPAISYNAASVAVPHDGWTGSELMHFVVVNKQGESVSMDINFTVVETPEYGVSGQETRLLVSKGILVSDYYLDSLMGNVVFWGPYDITVKVWEKR